MKISIKSFWPAIAWMTMSTIAFFIPGKSLPRNDWFAKVHFDKWIHVGLFSVMVVLWSLPLIHRIAQRPLTRLFFAVAIVFFGYGVLVEILQHYFSSYRSFDWGDIGADAVGCLVGYFYLRSQWKE